MRARTLVAAKVPTARVEPYLRLHRAPTATAHAITAEARAEAHRLTIGQPRLKALTCAREDRAAADNKEESRGGAPGPPSRRVARELHSAARPLATRETTSPGLAASRRPRNGGGAGREAALKDGTNSPELRSPSEATAEDTVRMAPGVGGAVAGAGAAGLGARAKKCPRLVPAPAAVPVGNRHSGRPCGERVGPVGRSVPLPSEWATGAT